jgi:hypothetical protein
MKEKK